MRRRRTKRRGTTGRIALLGFVTACVIAGGLVVMVAAILLTEIAGDLPDADLMADVWGPLGQESFTPVEVLDSRGQAVLYTFYPDLTEQPEWVRVRGGSEHSAPQYLLDAITIAVDPQYWDQSSTLFGAISSEFFNGTNADQPRGIVEQLAEAVLLPFSSGGVESQEARVQRVLLAADLATTYTKMDLLEWYINSADFGGHAYGVDAASLLYTGVHAWDLNLGQSAALAVLLADGGQFSEERQADVLAAMQEAGMISAEDAEDAIWSESPAPFEAALQTALPVLARIIETQIVEEFGSSVLGRPGLRILSSVDLDVYLQVECAAATQLARLNGDDPSTVIASSDGGACIAAGLLPPIRPGDANRDHQVTDIQVIVLENATGEVRALLGDIREDHPSGPVLYPFIYLTAFSQGYAPGSMVLDILPGTDDGEGLLGQGPVLIRTAIQEGLVGAAATMLEQLGLDAVNRTAASMAMDVFQDDEEGPDTWDPGTRSLSVLEAAMGYSVIANQGILRGMDMDGAGSSLPVVAIALEDGEGRTLYTWDSDQQAALSRPLAYLLLDILRDQPAQSSLYGPGSPLDLGRPAGTITAISPDGGSIWTIGFTPELTVVVWMGSEAGDDPIAVTALNGPAPLWHAIARYSTDEEGTVSDWQMPSGVSEIDICSPSGLLPTEYCPTVVREVFLQGTEPTQADNLYQPFLVNRETGKLATVYTPDDLVEERIYLIPPAGAEAWAATAGIPQPPQEYDVLYEDGDQQEDVAITSPAMFDLVRGDISVRGRVRIEELDFYRLQIGEGLNPSRWILVGDDATGQVYSGTLGEVDTSGMNGLYTIELVAVRSDGVLITDAVTVTVDNQPPEIAFLLQEEPGPLTLTLDEEMTVQVDVEDEVGVGEVVFYVDNRRVTELFEGPYSFRFEQDRPGLYEVRIRAYDLAGNFTDSAVLQIEVLP